MRPRSFPFSRLLAVLSIRQTLSALVLIQSMQRYRAEYRVRSPYADDLATVAICSLRAYHGRQTQGIEGTA